MTADQGRHVFDVVSTRTAYEGAIIAVREDDIVMPGGGVATRSVVEHYGAVAVVAVDMDGNVVLIDQYRQPVGRRLLELPAGLLDEWGEDPLDNRPSANACIALRRNTPNPVQIF